jgi:hypothetical protein
MYILNFWFKCLHKIKHLTINVIETCNVWNVDGDDDDDDDDDDNNN